MFLLRHGQSEFNLHFTRTRRDPGIPDPPLTPHGHAQARAAGRALARSGLQRIIVSPYTRALQTAAAVSESFSGATQVDPLVRERYAFACDIGSPRGVLAQDWPQHDFAAVEEVWWPDDDEPERAVIARAEHFRARMQADPLAPTTLLVSHWGFLLALTGTSLQNGEWMEWDPMQAAPREIVWQH